MAQGVVEKICRHLAEPHPIAGNHHGRTVAKVAVLQADLRRMGPGSEAVKRPCHQVTQVHRFNRQRQFAGIGQRQRAQVVHQAVEQDRLLVNGFEVFGRQRKDAVLQGLDRALDAAERRAQFVGDVGHQIAP